MVINFLVNPVFAGWEPTDTRLGGTEESVVEWAKELESRGHKVHVYRNGKGKKNKNYFERSEYKGGGDICINVKSYDIAPKEPTLYLTNETDAGLHDLSIYKGIIWPSKWAADNIFTNAKQTFILAHGYDPKNVFSGPKKRFQCFYASSPDRGLETLLRVWPSIHGKHPKSSLILTYGAKIPPIDGIKCLGSIDEKAMNKLYQTSDFWCHPCNGGELYCMTGVKAQAAGCIPVIIPTMALSETVRGGFWANDEGSYFNTLDNALSAPDLIINKMRKELLDEHFPTWEDSTDQLEQIINTVI